MHADESLAPLSAPLPDGWVRGYLDWLGVAPGPPDQALLARINRAHLLRVPFENVSKLLWFGERRPGQPPVPPFSTYLAGMRSRGLGGNCYAVGAALGRLLMALGYQVSWLYAHPNHMTVQATLGGRRFVVETCLVSPTFDPIDLDAATPLRCAAGDAELRWLPGAAGVRIERHQRGTLRQVFELDPRPRPLTWFAPQMEESLRPGTMFMDVLRYHRFTTQGEVSLVNNRLRVIAHGQIEDRTLGDVVALQRALEGALATPVPDLPRAVALLCARGRDIFAPGD